MNPFTAGYEIPPYKPDIGAYVSPKCANIGLGDNPGVVLDLDKRMRGSDDSLPLMRSTGRGPVAYCPGARFQLAMFQYW